MVRLGVLPGPQEDGRPGLVAVQPAAVDRVAAGEAVLEDEEEGGGEAVPTVRLAAAALHHHQVLVLLQGAGAAQAEDEAQQEEQEHQDEEGGHDCLQESGVWISGSLLVDDLTLLHALWFKGTHDLILSHVEHTENNTSQKCYIVCPI